MEGMTPEIILQALRNAGATIEGETEKRKKLMKKLDLPEHMSPNALLQALNLLFDLEGLEAILEQLET